MSNEIKPIAYFRATKEQGIVWGEDCCSEEAMFDGYDDEDEFSLPVYSSDVVEALQKENAELRSKAIAELVEKSYRRKIKVLEDEIEAQAKRIAELEQLINNANLINKRI